MKEFSEIELFELLKKKIIDRFFEENTASSRDISEWKGLDIVTFQEDLFEKTKSTVSEKWFYTYFKSDFKKLPRIDMLNILTEYAGYANWNEFTLKQKERQNPVDFSSENEETDRDLSFETTDDETNQADATPSEQVANKDHLLVETHTIRHPEPSISKPKPTKANKALWIMLSLIVLIATAAFIYFFFFYQKTYEFCFVDADRNSPITEPIEITIERKGFNPLEILTERGCVEFPSKEDTLLMTIKSTYYKQDTFKINLHSYQGKETIRLTPDDYNVMLRHYSKSSQGVKERIKMLDEMIANDALIYQVYDNEFFGVEVLSKKQYINLVSLPTTSLKNYVLIEAVRKEGKIIKIKFKIESDAN